MLSLPDTLLTDITMGARKPAHSPEQHRKHRAPEPITYKGHPDFQDTTESTPESGDVVVGSTVDIQSMIDEVIEGKPFKLQPEDAFRPGSELLEQLRPSNTSLSAVLIESGRSEKNMDMKFQPEGFTVPVYGMTLPGASHNGRYPANQDGVVMSYDKQRDELTLGVVHNNASTPEGSAATNIQTVSAAYDLSKLRGPELSEMVFRMNTRLAPIENELGNSFPNATLLRLKAPRKDDGEFMHEVQVATSGPHRCMVIDTHSGSVDASTPVDTHDDAQYLEQLYNRPVSEVLDVMEESAQESDKQIYRGLRERLESGKFTEDQIRQFLRNVMLEPRMEYLPATSGEIVVLAPEVAIEEFGGTERFAKYFSELMRDGSHNLATVCRAMMDSLEKTMNGDVPGREGHPLLDQSMSIVAFEVPAVPKSL